MILKLRGKTKIKCRRKKARNKPATKDVRVQNNIKEGSFSANIAMLDDCQNTTIKLKIKNLLLITFFHP